MNEVDAVLDTKSATISEKIIGILSSAADNATSSISDIMDKQNKKMSIEDESQLSVESLLKEIASNHSINDDCSTNKTIAQMNMPRPHNPQGLQGKKIVFIGYFRNNIALQVQKLLVGKGYKAHLEQSKIGNSESFVFCGPFKSDTNARKLLRWLHKHEFVEARLISVSGEAIEETLYDSLNNDPNMPENVEKDIPEMPSTLQNSGQVQATVQPHAPQMQAPRHMQYQPNIINTQHQLPPINRIQQPH